MSRVFNRDSFSRVPYRSVLHRLNCSSGASGAAYYELKSHRLTSNTIRIRIEGPNLAAHKAAKIMPETLNVSSHQKSE